MSRKTKTDLSFEISFFESVLRREPRDCAVIGILGDMYTKSGRVTDGLKMDRKLVRMRPDDAVAHYNLACSLSLAGKHTHALKTLAQAISLGYDDAEWMAGDPDLTSLKSHAAFKTLLRLAKKNRRRGSKAA